MIGSKSTNGDFVFIIFRSFGTEGVFRRKIVDGCRKVFRLREGKNARHPMVPMVVL